MKFYQNIFLSMLLVFFLLAGCANMTPRYPLSGEISGIDEGNSALLQLPSSATLSFFDDKEPTFSVKSPFNSQSIVQHRYRETLLPTGHHFLIYRHRLIYNAKGSLPGQEITYSQKGHFVTAIEFKRSHTYRIQTFPRVENGEYVFYGWIEELPFLMERREIKPGFNFNKQFEYWHNQDWKVVGVGLSVDKLPKINRPQLQNASIAGIDALKTKFPRLK